jgi:hypothetical protein
VITGPTGALLTRCAFNHTRIACKHTCYAAAHTCVVGMPVVQHAVLAWPGTYLPDAKINGVVDEDKVVLGGGKLVQKNRGRARSVCIKDRAGLVHGRPTTRQLSVVQVVCHKAGRVKTIHVQRPLAWEGCTEASSTGAEAVKRACYCYR